MAGTDIGFPKRGGGAKLGAFIVGAKRCGIWLIQLVVQCGKNTQHEEHALSKRSWNMPSQENFANLAF